MRVRCLSIFLTCVWFLWTGLVLPGHTPGEVSYRIGSARSINVAPTCPFCSHSKSKSPARPYYGCAMCDLKIKLYAGTIHIPSLAPNGLLEIARAPPALLTPFFRVSRPFQSRAPPALLAA
jgi:hypothetical protein